METVLIYGGIGLAVLFVAFVWWRWTSVVRGARKRDQRVLEMVQPIAEKLASKQQVSGDELEAIAGKPEARLFLYAMLDDFGALDLFPDRYLSVAAQAEAHLAYWMMHPNELQAAPEEIAPEAIVRKSIGTEEAAFHVLRYRMSDGHWAGRDWLLGLAGPFFDDDPPFAGPASAFARAGGDKAGEVDPEELVSWFVGMAMRRSSD